MSIVLEKHTNKEEWRFVGLSRSGNHAVINWVLKQLEGSYCFLNCVEPKSNPYTTARPFNEKGDCVETNISNFNIYEESKGRFSGKDHLLYSYEDCFLRTLNHTEFVRNRQKWVGRSLEENNVLILRDAFNLFASRIKSGLLLGHETHHGVKGISIHALKTMYKQHAREFLGLKNNLKDKVRIRYNQWAKDPDYRRLIAEKLGLSFNDSGISTVSECAGGSSFDGRNFVESPQKMQLEDRWKNYANSTEYWDLFDDEIAEYVYAIFGDIEALEYWNRRKPGTSGRISQKKYA